MWSQYGFAREVAAIFGKELKDVNITLREPQGDNKNKLDIKIEDYKDKVVMEKTGNQVIIRIPNIDVPASSVGVLTIKPPKLVKEQEELEANKKLK